MKKDLYEIRKVDAWLDCESWIWNDSFRIGQFTTSAKNQRRAFSNALKKLGFVLERGKYRIVDCMDVLEIQERNTGRPIFAAIFREGN